MASGNFFFSLSRALSIYSDDPWHSKGWTPPNAKKGFLLVIVNYRVSRIYMHATPYENRFKKLNGTPITFQNRIRFTI